MIHILQAWMPKFGYFSQTHNWVCLYYFTISEWDKKITIIAFQTCIEDNVEYIILITIIAYGIRINNLNIKLII